MSDKDDRIGARLRANALDHARTLDGGHEGPCASAFDRYGDLALAHQELTATRYSLGREAGRCVECAEDAIGRFARSMAQRIDELEASLREVDRESDHTHEGHKDPGASDRSALRMINRIARAALEATR